MNTSADIRWREPSSPPVEGAFCPVCGNHAPRPAILDVPSLAPPFGRLTLLRCPGCGSGHFDPPGVSSFADLGQNREDFWRFYVEVGGGVWETLWPVLADQGERSTLLDVGCGFGFAVDWWSRSGRGEAVGVELADYGQMGARLLGITVHDQLLEECEALSGRTFDVVYASEVVEHVPDAHSFVALLARYVAADGVLVLTTPSMAFVTPADQSPTLHAALAPGFHGFLLSASAFADTARRAGLAHVDVRSFGERQVLWASRVPLKVDLTTAPMFAQYLDYLVGRVAIEIPPSPVWHGMAYRLVKEWSNAGRATDAHALATRLVGALTAHFGADLSDPNQVLARLRACNELQEVGVVMPYFLPNLYFHLGHLAQRVERDGAKAARMYAGAIDCTLEICRFGSIFFLEAISLLWPARAALADVLLTQNRIDEGARLYAQLAAEGGIGSAAHAHATASLPLLETRVPAIAEHLRRQGLHEAARTVFAGYRRHIQRRYGDAWLTASGVDQALAQEEAPAPLDPLFAPVFAAMLSRGDGGPPSLPGDLDQVAAVALRWAQHPKWGAQMREHARHTQAAALAERNQGRVAWSMSTSFKL